ncbi:uncharacterized protein LOC131335271 [Rhododendron vialii]|uniref:uncharacterized protein LOC131335271 n=1 Tax=Rhododendron vialii TaxID=182163 RepID=UPI00265E7E00|nr:uncharacterized protein LOC131335271 [Rhododendron vialii]XP_058226533.1 uncharacterized protein LOC131335271 [Rhododendron vialii]XP_058226534.1 uncharacterized protein LOC131335271 [Rhododendron vialii]XP_058226535.1 uncharacterized protein LOC131335271 [Rhododendron vialii]
MAHLWQVWLPCLVTLLVALSLPNSQARVTIENSVRSAVFFSPEFVLGPGSVENKFYYDIGFPRGHIAVKSFNAEVVDEVGNPIPLHETYLHHWVVYRYYQRKGVEVQEANDTDLIKVRNSGLCDNGLWQYFGSGSETRRTATHVPDPYGIEVGNPAEIPPGYEEKWLLNVHAIDTRGVEDRLGCTECRCDLYNATRDENGKPLSPGYTGGMECCHYQTQCRVKEGFESVKRSLFMRYTVKWVDWDTSIKPVKIFVFDVTDTWKKVDASMGHATEHHCLVEYDVESCSAAGETNDGCTDSRRVNLTMPTGGSVIYGVGHQHTGGIGSTLYGEDGRVICSSIPTYGEGSEAGNETGYIVGMSTCYPYPGSVKISTGETLVLVSNYSMGRQRHTGVMGLFSILVADASPVEKHEVMTIPVLLWGVAFLFGIAIAIAVAAVAYRKWRARKTGYQSITT